MKKDNYRLIIVTLVFIALSIVLTLSQIGNLWIWGILILAWFVAERTLSPNVSLRPWQWIALIGGLFLLNFLVASLT